mgnify:CR=1 FL=1
MLAYQQIYPETSSPEDVWAAKQVQEFLNFNIYDADTGRGYSPEVMQYFILEIKVMFIKDNPIFNSVRKMINHFFAKSYKGIYYVS